MLQLLGRLLMRAQGGGLPVRYLSKAEGDPVWRDGSLVSIDTQGACFERAGDAGRLVECLPWGSIAAVEIGAEDAA